MAIDGRSYSDSSEIIRWLDVDPTSDSRWTVWSTQRTYAIVPDLEVMKNALPSFNFHRLATIASDLADELYSHGRSPPYSGLIKHDNVTDQQIRIITGFRTGDRGQPQPLRLDKLMLGLYAINSERDKAGQPPLVPRIYLSAYGICGLSRAFNALDKISKEAMREGLAKAIDQEPQFASELLKGNKVSLDAAIGAYNFLVNQQAFKSSLAPKVATAIETPSARHTPAAQFEDFARGRIKSLPAPFARPPAPGPVTKPPAKPHRKG